MAGIDINPDDFVVVMSMHRTLSRAAHDGMGGSLTDYRVLSCVATHAGTCRGADVCRELDLSRGATSMSIGRLRERGQVVCLAKEGTVHPDVTDIGRDVLESTHAGIEGTIAQRISTMPASSRQTNERLMVALADRLGVPLLAGTKVDLVNTYVEICSRAERLIRRNAVAHGLTANAFLVLCGIVGWGRPMRPGELSERLRMPKPLVTPACRRLTSSGLTREQRDERDGRGKVIIATPEGDDLLRQAVEDYWSAFFANSRPLTEEEFAFFRLVASQR